MQISKQDFTAAANGIVPDDQATALWAVVAAKASSRPLFDLYTVGCYFGALLVIGAMGWYMGKSWDSLSGGGLILISTAYAAAFILAGRTLWKDPATKIPGGLLITMAVCMTPLAVYDLEHITGLWPMNDPGSFGSFHPRVNGSWLVMEAATVLAGYIALRFFRFPFLVAPIAYALWFASMDLTPLLFGEEWVSWNQRQWISLWFGLAMLLVAFLVDRRTKGDYSFWLYLFGMVAFWGGLSSMNSGSEWGKATYCLINLALMALSVLLQRWIFIICGGLGVTFYIGHLAFSVFDNAVMFPFVLTLIGVAIMTASIFCRRHQQGIEQACLALVPNQVRTYLLSKRPPEA